MPLIVVPCRHASEGWHRAVWRVACADARRLAHYDDEQVARGDGVIAQLGARVQQHREGRGSAFCRRYGLSRLVLAQRSDTIEEAIAREKQVKAWRREWKITLIEADNPDWTDLFERIVQLGQRPQLPLG